MVLYLPVDGFHRKDVVVDHIVLVAEVVVLGRGLAVVRRVDIYRAVEYMSGGVGRIEMAYKRFAIDDSIPFARFLVLRCVANELLGARKAE